MQILIGKQLLHLKTDARLLGSAERTVVFLHGWGRTGDDFDRLVARLTPQFPATAFIQMDLPGFGGSPMVRQDGLSIEDYSAILKDLFDKLGVPRATLVGHSLGGRIAIKFAARFPERVEKLVLISAAGLPRRTLSLFLIRLARSLFNTAFSAVRDFAYILRLKNLLGATFGSRDYRVARGALRETLKKVLAEDLRPDAKKISAPALLLWGKDDRITPLRDAAEYHSLIRGSQLELLDGGHFVFLEKPEECAAQIISFLN